MSTKQVLTRDEVSSLVRACGKGRTANRNRALIVLLWRTGLRISEALDLRPSDLDREHQTVRVRSGKGDKSRTVPIDPSAYEVVRRFLEERAAWTLRRGSPVFPTLRGGRMSRRYVADMLGRLSVRAELDKRVHPHALRHTYASELQREGHSVLHIMRLLGHANLRTTSIYLAEVGTTAELVEVVRKRPPIGDANVGRVIGIAGAIRRSRAT